MLMEAKNDQSPAQNPEPFSGISGRPTLIFGGMNRLNFGKLFSANALIWLILLLVLLLNFTIRWRVRDMPLERDEGEYAYAGQLILQGIPPYKLAWNMKFPGVYFAYAGLMSCFGETPKGIHVGLILVTSISVVLMFLIGRELLNAAGGLLAATFFTLLSALPAAVGLAGHATHFVVLCVCLGTYALLRMEKRQPWFWASISGLAFGSAVLMKQHAIIFAAAAFAWLLWRMLRNGEKILFHTGVFSITAVAPLLVMAIGLAWAGVWDRFNLWAIQYAGEYVSIFPLQALPRHFAAGFGGILDGGIWIWLFGLTGTLLIFLQTPYRRAAFFGTGLLLAGLAATVPGFYFRGHYFLMVMPGIALLNAVLLLAIAERIKGHAQFEMLKLIPGCLFLVILGDLVVRNTAIWFELTPEQICREIYNYNAFPESAEIAHYLAENTNPDDTIAVLGSEPQIFFLARRHSASGYIYIYPLTEPQPMAATMRSEFFREIEVARPRYVVYFNQLSSWRSVNLPGQTQETMAAINHWWRAYSAQHYQIVGVVDMVEDQPSQFFWGSQILSRTNTSPAGISIFRRR
jgi:hypothetical protein